MSFEIIKAAIDKNNLPKEYNDVLKSIVDLRYAFFEERNFGKAKAECGKLILLMDKYQQWENVSRHKSKFPENVRT